MTTITEALTTPIEDRTLTGALMNPCLPAVADTEMVAGFLFTPNGRRVVLIRKNKPAWQRGKLNGVGGKVEPGETTAQAMRREFREEAGLDIEGWRPFATLAGGGREWRVTFFRATGHAYSAESRTDEKVEVWPVEQLPPTVIPNLRWLIPLALEPKVNHVVEVVEG